MAEINKKKISLRKCIITNELFPKKDLFRIVKTKDNELIYDPTGKLNGHGFYLKKDEEVITKAKKKLNKILAMEIDDSLFELLEKELNK